MTWLILVFNALMLLLLVSTGSIADRGPREWLQGALTSFWVAGDLILGVLWLGMGVRRRLARPSFRDRFASAMAFR